MLVLAHQGSGCDFGDHQTRVQARFGRQEGRQIKRQRRVHHQRHTALRDGPDFCQCQRDLIGGKGHWFRVEITA